MSPVSRHITRPLLLALAGVLLVTTLTPTQSRAAGEEGSSTPGFVESWGCDEPATSGPLASVKGWLTSSEEVRGPRGDYFGRSIGAIRNQLAWWTVPMSGGKRILVHARALPAFQQVAANLAVHEAAGRHYAVRGQHTYGYAARTISGKYRISNHGFGTAIDINSTTNPYRSDATLITDMPDWFVEAWQDAGFCWGGDWESVKDPMHFSWMGPAATPGYQIASEQTPLTNHKQFGSAAVSRPSIFGADDDDHHYALSDANGDGAADVVQVSQEVYGILIEYSGSNRDFNECSLSRFHVKGATIGNRIVAFGDLQGFGRRDLFLFDGSDGTLEIDVHLRALDELTERTVFDTGIPVNGSETFLLGDHDVDGVVDLFVIRSDSDRVEVWDGASGYVVKDVDAAMPVDPASGTRHYTLGDLDRDRRHDLVVMDAGATSTDVWVLSDDSGYASASDHYTAPFGGDWRDVTVNDFDGDGRGDLWTYAESGLVSVHLGNTSRYADIDGWMRAPDWDCTEVDHPIPYTFDGRFYDDDGNVHEATIEEIAAVGITLGCNPPYNDAFCPDRQVTRGQMAAFLVRARGLTDDGGRDWFVDDDASVFEQDINRLRAAGITFGCNPPANDRFCPAEPVTRQQMAAFLVRAFHLPSTSVDAFVDDDGSIFEADIDALAAARVTFGCNPPANDRFCPSNRVTRAQMASFLARVVG